MVHQATAVFIGANWQRRAAPSAQSASTLLSIKSLLLPLPPCLSFIIVIQLLATFILTSFPHHPFVALPTMPPNSMYLNHHRSRRMELVNLLVFLQGRKVNIVSSSISGRANHRPSRSSTCCRLPPTARHTSVNSRRLPTTLSVVAPQDAG